MDWVQLLIPLIAIAVWILSSLASGQREPPRRPGPRPTPENPEARRRAAASSTELESFLEDMRQRKKDEDPVEPVVVAEEVRRPAPPPPLPRRQEQLPRREEQRREEPRRERREEKRRPAPQRAVERKPTTRQVEPLVLTPVAVGPPPSTAPLLVLPAPEIKAGASIPRPVVERVGSRSVAPPEPVRIPAQASTSSVVFELLKSRHTLAGAFLLREVLDRPRCQRPPGQ